MCRVPVVITFTKTGGQMLLALVKGALVERLDALRAGVLAAHRVARDLDSEEVKAEFRVEALDLIESDLVQTYLGLSRDVPPIEAAAAGEPTEAECGF